jgi:hypothetical protein
VTNSFIPGTINAAGAVRSAVQPSFLPVSSLINSSLKRPIGLQEIVLVVILTLSEPACGVYQLSAAGVRTRTIMIKFGHSDYRCFSGPAADRQTFQRHSAPRRMDPDMQTNSL